VKFRGELILSYVILYAATRSVVEIFRGDPRGYCFDSMISTSGLISIVAVAVSIVLYYIIKDKNRILNEKIKGERVKKK
jgi:phosphatidylglycerol:prolipoprotein diacylglycerol transferase